MPIVNGSLNGVPPIKPEETTPDPLPIPNVSQQSGFWQDNESPKVNPFLSSIPTPPRLAPLATEESPQDKTLRIAFDSSYGAKTEEYARVERLQNKTGLTADVIQPHLNELEQIVQTQDFNPTEFRKRSPILAKWLSENPDYMKVIRPDIDKLNDLEQSYVKRNDRMRQSSQEELEARASHFADHDFQQRYGQASKLKEALGPRYDPDRLDLNPEKAFEVTGGYASWEERFKAMKQQELDRQMKIQSFIANWQPQGAGEILSNRFEENPNFLFPWSFANDILNSRELNLAKEAQVNGNATPWQNDLLLTAGQVQEAIARRGKTFFGGAIDMAKGIPSFIGQAAIGAEIASGIEATGVLSYLGKSALSSTGLLGETVSHGLERMSPIGEVKTKDGSLFYETQANTGESAVVAFSKAALGSWADMAAVDVGKVLGKIDEPINALLYKTVSKAFPEFAAPAAFHEVLNKVGINGVVSMIGMSRASELMHAVAELHAYRLPFTEGGADLNQMLQEALVGSAVPAGEAVLGGIESLTPQGKAKTKLARQFEVKQAFAKEAQIKAQERAAQIKTSSDHVESILATKQAPQVMEEAISKITKDTPDEFRYIPRAVWDEKISTIKDERGNPLIPRDEFIRVVGDAKAYDQASPEADLTIPTPNYEVRISPESKLLFQDEIRRDPMEDSVRETKDLLDRVSQQRSQEKTLSATDAINQAIELVGSKELKSQAKKIGEDAKDSVEKAARKILSENETKLKDQFKRFESEIAQIKEEVAKTAKAIGRPVGESNATGELASRMVARLAKEAKQSPLEYYNQRFPTIGKSDLSGSSSIASDKKGFFDRAAKVIGLLPSADASTLLHELSHFYISELERMEASKQISTQGLEDMKIYRAFVGAEEGKPLTDAQHEKGARGFEAYLMEGEKNAPSKALRVVFARMAEWMLGIYKSIKALGVELSPEIRGFYDRMLASEEEIRAAQAQQGEPLDAKLLGLTPEEKVSYEAQIEKARERGRKLLHEQVRRQLQREKSKERKDRADAIRPMIEASVDGRPEQIAMAFLREGTKPDGSNLEEPAFKLSQKGLQERFGEEIPQSLDGTYAKNGIDLEMAAEKFGYRSADEMLSALDKAGDRNRVVDRLVKAQIKLEFGDLEAQAALPEEAMKAIHNDEQAKLDLMTMRFLAEKSKGVVAGLTKSIAGSRIPRIEQIREDARNTVLDTAYRLTQPHVWQQAERKAHDKAIQLLSKGDFFGAQQSMREKVVNHELYRAAVDAREHMDRITSYAKKFANDSVRSKIAKLDAQADPTGSNDYLGQIDSLLNRFEFVPATLETIKARQSLQAWIAQKEAKGESLGESIQASEDLKNEAYRKNYKDMTYRELLSIDALFRQIETMARENNRRLTSEKEISRDQDEATILASIEKNGSEAKTQPLTKEGKSFSQKSMEAMGALNWTFLRPEEAFIKMDGGKRGILHDILFNTSSEAQSKEYDLKRSVSSQIAKAIELMPDEIKKRSRESVKVTGFDRKITRKDAMAIFGNMLNFSSYDKLVRGEMKRRGGGLSETQLQEIVGQLTKSEKDYVQGLSNTMETLWPLISQLSQDVRGLPPDKLEPRRIVTAHGIYEGGYWPAFYDATETIQGEKQLDKNIGDLTSPSYVSATLDSGYRTNRIQGFAAPMDFNLDRLPNHIDGVIKDLTHRKWLIDANWLVNNRNIMSAISDHFGQEYAEGLKTWVKQVVNSSNAPSSRGISLLNRALNQVRTNTVIAQLGFRASTALIHVTGIGAAIDIVGPKAMADGLAYVAQQPGDAYRIAMEKSGEMRHFIHTSDRDVRYELDKLEGKSGALANTQRAAMYAIQAANFARALPAWWGSYREALATLKKEGLRAKDLESQAVHIADSNVRRSIGSAGPKDLPQIMAKNAEAFKLFTMFYTPGSLLYARMYAIKNQTHGIADIPKAMGSIFLSFALAAALHEVSSGRTPKEDEGWLAWWAKSAAAYPFMAIPFGRDAANYIESGGKRDFQLSPIADAANTMFKPALSAFDSNKDWGQFSNDVFKASGYWFGLPTKQASITANYLWDLHHGQRDANNIFHFGHDILFPEQKN